MIRLLGFVWIVVAISTSAHAQIGELNSKQTLWDEVEALSPWVFLGDSNTYAGGYVAVLDALINGDKNHGPRPRLLNLGVSSETASGLSEVDHPFKRPCVHQRLEKVLAMTRPGVVFICYGMNDGIYQPANQENLAAYRAGMMKLAGAIRKSGAKLICLTPPIFEPEPLDATGKLGPTGDGRYAYFAPARDYDEAIRQQADWCVSNEMGADAVVNIHELLHADKRVRLQENSGFAYSKDGVHFGGLAHGLVAEAVLHALGAPERIVENYPSNRSISVATRHMKLLRNAFLSATGKNRPGLAAGLPVWVALQRVQQTSEVSPIVE